MPEGAGILPRVATILNGKLQIHGFRARDRVTGYDWFGDNIKLYNCAS